MSKAKRNGGSALADAPRMFSTKNDLDASVRIEVAALLNQRLADGIDLQTQCKQAHWNVKGPNFIALHKQLDVIVHAVEGGYYALIAARTPANLGLALETMRTVAVELRKEMQ